MIVKTCIAGINTKVTADNKNLLKKLEPFLSDFRGEPLVSVNVTDGDVTRAMEDFSGIDRNRAAMRLFTSRFFGALPELGGFGVKGAAVSFGDRTFVIACGGEEEREAYLSDLLALPHSIKVIDDSCAAVMKNGSGYSVFGTPASVRTPLTEGRNLSGIILPGPVQEIGAVGRKEFFDRMMLCIPVPARAEQLGAVMACIDLALNSLQVSAVPEKDPAAFYSFALRGPKF